MTTEEIKKELKAAIGARKDSLADLRDRIVDLTGGVPVGTKLADDQGVVGTIEEVCTGASQWANRTWEATIHGWALIDASGRLVAESLADSVFDGRNHHYRKDEPTCLRRDGEPYNSIRLSWANDAQTRAVAARLPGAIARYMEECRVERAANDATVVTREEA